MAPKRPFSTSQQLKYTVQEFDRLNLKADDVKQQIAERVSDNGLSKKRKAGSRASIAILALKSIFADLVAVYREPSDKATMDDHLAAEAIDSPEVLSCLPQLHPGMRYLTFTSNSLIVSRRIHAHLPLPLFNQYYISSIMTPPRWEWML